MHEQIFIVRLTGRAPAKLRGKSSATKFASRSHRFGLALLTISLLLTTLASANAQEVDAAIVVGTVIDSSQAAVANATVKLTHLATNSVTEVHTNERGEYRTSPLRLG